MTLVCTLEEHENSVLAIAVFSDGQRMVTGSRDKTLRLWNLNNGVMLKKMEGHRSRVSAVVVSRDGKLQAVITRERSSCGMDSGESLAQAIKAHYVLGNLLAEHFTRRRSFGNWFIRQHDEAIEHANLAVARKTNRMQ
jgi:WD40 repeat protein